MKTLNVVVKKDFPDKYTGVKHKVGEKLKITEQRFREIKRSGDYVDIEKSASEAPAKKESK